MNTSFHDDRIEATKINKNMTRSVIIQHGFSSAMVNMKNKAGRSNYIVVNMLTV